MAADDFRWELFRPRLQLSTIPYHGLLQHTVDRFPDKIATVFGSEQLSFREIDGLSSSPARSLHELHVTKGDRVALFMTNCPEYLISFEAVSKAAGDGTPALQLEVGNGVEGEHVRFAAFEAARRRHGDHGGVVGAVP
jgi:non-ribosomal peptide synthetase component E (peptide arylation enzyme)